MSNPDLPGSYWQDDASYGSEWRGVRRDEDPWDNERFWRDERAPGRSPARDNASRPQPGRDAQDQAGPRPPRAARRGPGGGDSSWPDMLAGRSRRAARDDWDADEPQGRLGQAADDMRSRLGMRGSAARRDRGGPDRSPGRGVPPGRPEGRSDEEFWAESDRRRPPRPGSRRAGAEDNGNGTGYNGNGDRRNGYGRNGSPRNGSGPNGSAPNGSGRNGGSGYGRNGAGYGRNGHAELDRAGFDGAGFDGVGFDGDGGRTALREPARNDWAADGGRHGQRSRLADRPDVRPGRRGGGGGGRGTGGGRGGASDGAPGSRGDRFKQWLLYGSWWRHWTWKKALAVVGVAAAAMVLVGVIGIWILYSMTPIPTAASETALWQYSSVYFSNGKLLGTFTNSEGINRQLLSSSQIPTVMNQAMIAAEDRNFYSEGGISLTGILRAGYEDIFGSGGLQGGSTITEEYAKNYYSNIGYSRTASTKIKEIFVSIKLAHEKSKPWILTQYLNTVPFGNDAYGAGAAAQAYFGINLAKPGATLTVAQAAMLAAMPNEPSYFVPDSSAGAPYQALVQRWQYVLTNMARDNAITPAQADALCANCDQAQADQAFNKNIKIATSDNSDGWSGLNGYLMQMVQQELTSPPYKYSLQYLSTKGLKITTTFNDSMVKALASSVNQEKAQMRAEDVPLPDYDHFGASVENPHTGAIVAIYGGPGYLSNQKLCRKLDCQYNMAEAPHPVGSSMKPYVLATAIDQGMDVQDSVLNGNSPLWIPPDWTAADRAELSQQKNPYPTKDQATSNGWWESDSDTPLGAISVQTAAAQSSDPAFADLAHKVGVQNIISMAGDFGVGATSFDETSPNDLTQLNGLFGEHGSESGSVQITFGQSNLTPIEQASTFATLADGGVYTKPHVVSGLYTQQNPQTNLAIRAASHVVLSPAAAADEDYALSADNVDGTAYPNATWPGRTVIGKTGTLGNGQNASEAWFLGAIPQYSMAIGLWTNSQKENLDNLAGLGGISGSYGGAWPAATWHNFMTTEFGNLPADQFGTPDYNGFTKWVQVQQVQPTEPTCKAGQGASDHCTCPTGSSGPLCGGPNPAPTCGQPFSQPCGGTSPSPSPSPTCGFGFGQPCSNPSPSPSATCTQGFGQPPCNPGGKTTASTSRQVAGVSATLLVAGIPPAEEQPLSVITDRIRAYAAGRSG